MKWDPAQLARKKYVDLDQFALDLRVLLTGLKQEIEAGTIAVPASISSTSRRPTSRIAIPSLSSILPVLGQSMAPSIVTGSADPLRRLTLPPRVPSSAGQPRPRQPALSPPARQARVVPRSTPFASESLTASASLAVPSIGPSRPPSSPYAPVAPGYVPSQGGTPQRLDLAPTPSVASQVSPGSSEFDFEPLRVDATSPQLQRDDSTLSVPPASQGRAQGPSGASVADAVTPVTPDPEVIPQRDFGSFSLSTAGGDAVNYTPKPKKTGDPWVSESTRHVPWESWTKLLGVATEDISAYDDSGSSPSPGTGTVQIYDFDGTSIAPNDDNPVDVFSLSMSVIPEGSLVYLIEVSHAWFVVPVDSGSGVKLGIIVGEISPCTDDSELGEGSVQPYKAVDGEMEADGDPLDTYNWFNATGAVDKHCAIVSIGGKWFLIALDC